MSWTPHYLFEKILNIAKKRANKKDIVNFNTQSFKVLDIFTESRSYKFGKFKERVKNKLLKILGIKNSPT